MLSSANSTRSTTTLSPSSKALTVWKRKNGPVSTRALTAPVSRSITVKVAPRSGCQSSRSKNPSVNGENARRISMRSGVSTSTTRSALTPRL
jgi:hypothetical protein